VQHNSDHTPDHKLAQNAKKLRIEMVLSEENIFTEYLKFIYVLTAHVINRLTFARSLPVFTSYNKPKEQRTYQVREKLFILKK
jgi:hypothetical protein